MDRSIFKNPYYVLYTAADPITPLLMGQVDAKPGNVHMIRSLIRLMVLSILGSFLMPVLLSFVGLGGVPSPGFFAKAALMTCAALIATAVMYYLLQRLEPLMDAGALEQVRFLDELDLRYVDLGIVTAAALSLFLELGIIRWQSSVFEFFAFYKNFSLLACFVGLGLGYALATRDRIPLFLTIPLLTFQFGFMMVVRFGLGREDALRDLPFREQLTMGLGVAHLSQGVALFALLTIVFLITALGFIPVGQLCGRLMERRNKLRAYGLNLLGSLVGVLIMLAMSFLWTPPLAWFALCFLAILLLHFRKQSWLLAGFISTVVCVICLAWPVNPLWDRVYSPYQLLEIGHSDDTGLTLIRAAGHYYQRIYDLSGARIDDKLAKIRSYYDFAYKAHPQLADVAIVGAGTGNDIAAALRSGAQHVDAIEIDPAIQMAGRANHPEKPYSDPRVRAVVNDARSFFRTAEDKYDLIVYGLLDSHTLLSSGSSVRLDSFVYTVEGLREARSRLKPDGVISLSFTVLSEALARKIYMMMQQAFDGRPPVCVTAGYDGAVIFLESNEKDWTLPAKLVEDAGFIDQTRTYADPTIQADVSTDDWPFFYMPRRIYPTSYLLMVFQVLILSLFIAGNFISERPTFSHLSFFFLGVGFMLVETKGITEMGLTFGNTWQVIGFVVVGILTMAGLGNLTVQWMNIKQPIVPYLLLCVALGIGWFIAKSGGFSSTPMGRLGTIVVLTCPVFFSGVVFSTLLSSRGAVSGMMAMNLLGAICGGLLEYNSMYFGFRSLYLVAIACYLCAFAADVLFGKGIVERTTDPRLGDGVPL
jgi:spermidine synthase